MFFRANRRTLVKSTVQFAHHAGAVVLSTAAINAVVQPEEDSTTESACELGGFVVGTAIWYKTNSYVQNGIDRIADKRRARKLENLVETAA